MYFIEALRYHGSEGFLVIGIGKLFAILPSLYPVKKDQ